MVETLHHLGLTQEIKLWRTEANSELVKNTYFRVSPNLPPTLSLFCWFPSESNKHVGWGGGGATCTLALIIFSSDIYFFFFPPPPKKKKKKKKKNVFNRVTKVKHPEKWVYLWSRGQSPPPPQPPGCLILKDSQTLHIPTNKKLEVWTQYRLLLSFLGGYFSSFKKKPKIRKNPEKSKTCFQSFLIITKYECINFSECVL